MTENEAKKLIAKFCEDRMNFARGKDMSDKELDDFCKFSDALNLSISSLEEIQQYRAIGTVKEVKRMQRYSAFAKHSTIGKVIDSCAEYEAIGTVEEFREARERQRGKKPEFESNLSDYTSRFVCECGKRVIVKHDSGVMDNHDAPNYCSNCGQRFDWSDTD